jgi:parallel beta-helix repeat protein
MKNLTVRSLVFCILRIALCGFTLLGCMVATKKTLIAPEIQEVFEGTYKVDPYLTTHMPRTVAILPFVDRSKSKEGVETVRRGFYNHFGVLPYTDVELYRVDSLLRKAGLTDPEVIRNTPPQKLGEILKVDAVVFGEVSDFDKFFAVLYSQVAVGAEIKMFDTQTGHFLWSGQHVARKHEGGISTSPVGIVAAVVFTAMNVRDVQLLRACDDLFRDMVKTIPVPTIAEVTRPPVITLLTQDAKGIAKKIGDEIKVVVKGDPGMQASFDIGTFQKRIDMVEVEPGGYLGIYRVVPGDNVTEAIVTGYLSDDSGNMTSWIDPVGTVTIDTAAPSSPNGLGTLGRDSCVILEWTGNSEADLAGYRVYRSKTPLTGFEAIDKTEFNRYKDEGVSNFHKYYYEISAVDRAGNESKRQDAVLGMAIAPGPTPFSGVVTEDTTWYAGASPYVLEGPVTIRDKAALTIEPGTIIQSAGSGLRVEGRLLARGDEARLIILEGQNHKPWKGISFHNVQSKENLVQFCRISHADVGISCQSSSPVINDCEFVDNTDGIRVMGSFSEPEIFNNTIHRNRGIGLAALEGARPTIKGNTVRENSKGGALIEGAAPVIVHNSIAQNMGYGVSVVKGQAEIQGNNIHDNEPYDMLGSLSGEPVRALDNWWGTKNGLDILARIKGRIDIGSILDGPYSLGKSFRLPILEGPLGGEIRTDGFLTLSNSPYTIEKDIVVDGGAILYVEPGVRLMFDQDTSIILEDGGMVARGKRELPIVFTSSGASSSPGDYLNAVRFAARTKVNSFFEYCVFEHATTAVDIHFGSPKISYCYVGQNAQSGIKCRNDAAPVIFYNTITGNMGTGGIECVGMAKPKINHNNIVGNAVGIQAFSTILIDARYNWWGKSPPDDSLIWGGSINLKPWLEGPEEKAFAKD